MEELGSHVDGAVWVRRRLRFERLLDDLVATALPGDEPTTDRRDGLEPRRRA